jgi:hypothetical protein
MSAHPSTNVSRLDHAPGRLVAVVAARRGVAILLYRRALPAGAGVVLSATLVAALAPRNRRSTPVIEEAPVLDLAT